LNTRIVHIIRALVWANGRMTQPCEKVTLVIDEAPSPEETCRLLASFVIGESRQDHCPTLVTNELPR